jgi:putative endonuclease
MAYYVYVLRSTATGRFYTGSSSDTVRRLAEHNRGKVASTRGRGPWELVHCEAYVMRCDAVRRERYLKSMKSRSWLAAMVWGGVGESVPTGREGR